MRAYPGAILGMNLSVDEIWNTILGFSNIVHSLGLVLWYMRDPSTQHALQWPNSPIHGGYSGMSEENICLDIA